MDWSKLDIEADFAAYQKQLEADFNFAPDVDSSRRWNVTPEMLKLARNLIRSQGTRRKRKRKGGR